MKLSWDNMHHMEHGYHGNQHDVLITPLYRHKCLVDRLLSQGYKYGYNMAQGYNMADIRISLRNIGGQSMQW